jgi:TolB-like protein/cytochrome c-type biogenesis protein CcmH/NrfG
MPVPLLIALAVAVIGLGYFALDKFVLSKRPAVGAETSVSPHKSGGAGPSAIPEKSIAVLPFVDMSEKKDQDYFSDGLTEEMIDLLGQVPELRVPARTSSFYFKGRSEDIATIAQKLHVAHVLEGSVRKAGKRLRITAQLIRADSGYHLWSQAYDRDDTDVFAVQDDIAKAVVMVLRVKLSAGAHETGSRGTTNTEAYYQYLLGRQLDRRDSLEGFRHAVEAYSQAIELDPNYAGAYAGLAVAEASVADLTGDTGGIERAEHNADKALALAPEDAIGYAARSYLRTVWLWDRSGAQADIEKALSLDPRNSDVQREYARLLADLGRLPEAIAAQKKATELDPLSSAAWENLGFYYTGIGDFAAADAALGRAIDIEPTSVLALSDLGMARLLQGKSEEALEAFRKIDLEAIRLTGIAMAEHTLRHAKESQQALEELMAKHAQEAAYQIAQALAWRGEKDRAFEWLERAYKQRDGGLSEIRIAPMLRSLHADPRFNALLRKVKLPELPAGSRTPES